MSAYVVQDKTINTIVTFMRDSRDFQWITKPASLFTQDACQQFGQNLFDLNCEAVNQRYGENQAQEFRPLDYEFKYELSNIFQAYKSLRCFLYQCSEGNVPETVLFKKMDEISSAMAHHIVSRMPEYDACKWD